MSNTLPYNPSLAGLPVYLPGRPIEEVARELGLPPSTIIKLASNENPLGPSPLALVPPLFLESQPAASAPAAAAPTPAARPPST